jgi:hypothetical protein
MGVLLMLLTIGGSLVAAGLFAIAWLNDSSWLKKFVAGAVAIWLGFYMTVLLAVSFSSEEKVLSLNEPKKFCGFYLDCHMHTAVSGVRKAKTIGDRTAKGEFYIVKVNVFSNAARARLGLSAVDAHVVDASRTEYTRDETAEAELPLQPDFETKVRPEESFEKEIVFDLPVDVKGARLGISEGHWIERMIETFLVGDEDSMIHKRTYHNISEQNAATRVN